MRVVTTDQSTLDILTRDREARVLSLCGGTETLGSCAETLVALGRQGDDHVTKEMLDRMVREHNDLTNSPIARPHVVIIKGETIYL